MLRKRQKRYQRSTEFYLPIVMERIVMSVQAGLDIFPAVRTALATGSPEVKSEDDVGNVAKYRDPVSRLLAMAVRLTERGLSFDESLNHVARMIDSSGMRHAFIHLGLAQREGGELIGPLRELSDSTQIYFQESVEEEIAGMPVKATMPLMLTFAGLISFCMASPIIQLLEFLQQAANQFK